MEKILTVSIAAYNVYNYLNETLTPFLGVKGNDRLEVLIIDDGATDGTLELALEYQEKYPNVFRVIHKENGGWGSTVTTGILNATGKYFKLLDGDDYYNKDSEMKDMAEVIIAKQRNGPIGTVNLVWMPQYTKFANATRPGQGPQS